MAQNDRNDGQPSWGDRRGKLRPAQPLLPGLGPAKQSKLATMPRESHIDPEFLRAGLAKRVDAWHDRLALAFADRRKFATSLALAEEAVAACPGAPILLLMAAQAALFQGAAERALFFLKRFDKMATSASAGLMRALAMHLLGQTGQARTYLERHKLNRWSDQLRVFPGGAASQRWLAGHMQLIISHGGATSRVDAPSAKVKLAAGPNATGPIAKRGAAVARAKSSAASAHVVQAPVAPLAAIAPTPAVSSLPQIEIALSFELNFEQARFESALQRMLAAEPARDPGECNGNWFGLRERLAHLSLVQGFDELLCNGHLSGVQPLWHQIETVRKVLRQFRGRVLLADEVGLGKTIEACMVLKEYALRGMAERALILTPASLVGQWREELEAKFSLPFATTYDALLREDPKRFWAQKHVVASIATARRKEHAEHLAAAAYDIVIVDEAHHLKDRSSQSWKTIDSLNKRFLLLLSATPVQNDLIELYNLLTLLKPGIFKTPKEFRAAHITPGKPRVPANPEALRALMRDAMIRNTRAAVAIKLPLRHASTLKIDGAPGEAAAYAALNQAVRAIGAGEDGGRQRLLLRHLLSAAGSSTSAAAAAATRMAERDPKSKTLWTTLARQWSAIGESGKERALFDLLGKNPAEKKIVFVEARETLDHLSARFESAGIGYARFDGSLSGPQKDDAVAKFRDAVNVLICTQSGGEGRNIQFCNTLINFDIPWNPMAIEQRIGRIDRIGQDREVFVFNLVTRGTLEEQILVLLDEKIAMFEMVVGEVGAILGGLEEDREFPDLVLEAWLQCTEGERIGAFDAIGQSLTAARQQHDGAKALDETLFGEDFDTA